MTLDTVLKKLEPLNNWLYHQLIALRQLVTIDFTENEKPSDQQDVQRYEDLALERGCDLIQLAEEYDTLNEKYVTLAREHAKLVEAARGVIRWYDKECHRHVDEIERMERLLIDEPCKALDEQEGK